MHDEQSVMEGSFSQTPRHWLKADVVLDHQGIELRTSQHFVLGPPRVAQSLAWITGQARMTNQQVGGDG